jgi:hypothetical protein
MKVIKQIRPYIRKVHGRRSLVHRHRQRYNVRKARFSKVGLYPTIAAPKHNQKLFLQMARNPRVTSGYHQMATERAIAKDAIRAQEREYPETLADFMKYLPESRQPQFKRRNKK